MRILSIHGDRRLNNIRWAAVTLAMLPTCVASLGAQAPPPPVTLDLNFESAVEVARLFDSDSVSDADLDRVFRLPGVRALYLQARRFDEYATEENFRSTLRAAVEGLPVQRDPFNFQTVRDRIEEIAPTIEWIGQNHEKLAADLGRRIAEYSPAEEALNVPVYLVLGGSSDGWARDGVFHVALHYFRDDLEGLKLLMAHELFHVAQGAFMSGPTVTEERPQLRNVEALLLNTVSEGTASLLWWPDDMEGGVYVDGVLRAKLERNRRRADGTFSLFELMVFRAHADPDLDVGSIYNLGLSGRWDSPLYYVGYRIARAIEEHRGRPALRKLLARPAVEFFQAYVDLYRDRPADSTLLRFSPRIEEILAQLHGLP